MKNHIQPGRTLTIPAPADVVSGGVVVAGSIVGVANGDALAGADVDVDVEGVFELEKVSALAINLGDTVYYDAATKLVNKTASGNTKAGYATAAAANPSASVPVRLVPTI
jgi:predicted RecA/RadA family phage recombinase